MTAETKTSSAALKANFADIRVRRRAGFSPRKNALVVYLYAGLNERFAAQIKKLGKCKASKGCLYIKRLADVDAAVLRDMIAANITYLRGMQRPMGKDAAARKSSKKH